MKHPFTLNLTATPSVIEQRYSGKYRKYSTKASLDLRAALGPSAALGHPLIVPKKLDATGQKK